MLDGCLFMFCQIIGYSLQGLLLYFAFLVLKKDKNHTSKERELHGESHNSASTTAGRPHEDCQKRPHTT